jgi:hypothetical protein
MYGKAPKMTNSKKAKPVMPMSKPKPMPVRGQRTMTNKAAKKK